ncbi:phage tail protein [Gluconacetobacter johannae]|uniref:Phage tail protein n=1 Tax=Gluconacetobacter johannae TaxID=112140 RepID=A0A7W4J8R5_9PROT|nr:phage tail protein [Gluconacetobacter johannae]
MSGLLSSITDVLGYGSQPSDDVSIIIGNTVISGWTDVTIRVGIEIMPWTAELSTTEWQPELDENETIQEGDACQIKIGNDLVITGYVITVDREVGPEEHIVRVSVASKSVDLVEGAAEFATYQMTNTNALALVKKVCEPAGISVYPVGLAGITDIQQFSVILTETAYEVIERICRFAACLFYDRPDGNITLSDVGSSVAVSGFVLGGNAERMRRRASMAGRYADVTAIKQTPIILFSSPDEDDFISQLEAETVGQPATDPGVTRPWRHLLIPYEQGDAGGQNARKRVLWEVARRYGRSQVIEVTCDSWRDASGKLWQPNTIAQVTAPRLKFNGPLLIAELVFHRDEDGTHADVVLMPPEAFQPEPILLPMQSNLGVQAITSNDAPAPVSGITATPLPPLMPGGL